MADEARVSQLGVEVFSESTAVATARVAQVGVEVFSRNPAAPIGGAVLHLEGEDITFSGSDVTGWTDKSINGYDLATVSGSPSPQVATTPTGENCIEFTSADSNLIRRVAAAAPNMPGGATDRTIFFVAKYDSVGAGGFGYGDGATNEMLGVYVDDSGDLFLKGWGGANDHASTEAGNGAGWLTQSVTVASNTFTHYKDNVQIDTGSQTYNTDVDTAGCEMVVGGDIDFSPRLDMSAAAVIVYDRALDASELAHMQTYLHTKYLATASAGGEIKVWDGAAWVTKPVKVWTGAAWETKPVKYWDGAAWVTTP